MSPLSHPAPLPSQKLRSIHLLRALLRETSYLPDPKARSYFHDYILSRFKAYQPVQKGSVSFKQSRNNVIYGRVLAKQREARKGLNYLRRANLGERPCLEKVLYLAYGRMGRRRRVLLEELMKPEPAVGEEDKPAPLHQLYYTNTRCLQVFDAPQEGRTGKDGEERVFFDFSDRYPKLKVVLIAQLLAGVFMGREFKQVKVYMDKYNAWRRPMPIKRARNHVRRNYALKMEKVLPPLPSEEWDQLAAQARGEVRWQGPVARRTPALPRDQTSSEGEIRYDATAIKQGLALERPSKADRPVGDERPQKLTSRTMRRIYAKVLGYCCKLEYNEDRGRWRAVWPSAANSLSTVYTRPTEEVLFAGVDSQGKKPKQECVSAA